MNAESNIIPIDSTKSIELKIWILEKLKFVLLLFYFPKMALFVINGYDQVGYLQIEALFQILDFFNLGFVVYVYRPREKWPEHFTKNLSEL